MSRESLQRDTNQLRVVEHLEELRMNLCDYHPTEPGLLQRVREREHVYAYHSFYNGSCLVVLTNHRRKSKESTFMDQLVSQTSTFKINTLTHSFSLSHLSFSLSLSLSHTLGSGKTMLMDMFYSAVNMKRKQRIHFNEFMLNTHNSELVLCSKTCRQLLLRDS